jgi:nickel-dependent lactate racemase
MPLCHAHSSPDAALTLAQQRAAIQAVFDARPQPPRRLLLIPPDITRANSGAGTLTRLAVECARARRPRCHIAILPALGTHAPMSAAERTALFGDLPADLFVTHNWRSGLAHLGDVPATFIRDVSRGQLDYSVSVEINALLRDGNFDLILSLGQVVPHEVIGMANGNKNILVGVGGKDTINKTHFLGAVCNMETILGRADNPVRAVFNYAEEHFFGDLPIVYVQTVMATAPDGTISMRGLFAGTGHEPFLNAAALSQQLNITLLDAPIRKAVVYLDPHEFKSTWLGNKAIYRTRMAMADDGELLVIAPGVETFGEDAEINRLIAKYGYRGTPTTLAAVRDNQELRENLSAAAHLIHGSSEGRFTITYAPGKLTRAQIEAVGFAYAPLDEMLPRYQPARLRNGCHTIAGEDIFYISNPALGLWALPSQF